jgi:hypothetical protein
MCRGPALVVLIIGNLWTGGGRVYGGGGVSFLLLPGLLEAGETTRAGEL